MFFVGQLRRKKAIAEQTNEHWWCNKSDRECGGTDNKSGIRILFLFQNQPVHSLIRSCGIVRITGASEKMEIQWGNELAELISSSYTEIWNCTNCDTPSRDILQKDSEGYLSSLKLVKVKIQWCKKGGKRKSKWNWMR